MSWETLPEWVRIALPAGLGAVGTLALGIVQAKADTKRTRSDDRVVFTSQVLERLSAVEELVQEERRHYEARLASRDKIIAELRDAFAAKDLALQEALRRITHLEQLLQGLGYPDQEDSPT